MLISVQETKQAETKIRDGNQTLARGLFAFQAIVDSEHGMTVQQVGELLDVHRSIAYRLLQTLCDFGFIVRNSAGVYLPGAWLATLADAYVPSLRDAAIPVMRTLADRLGSTIGLFAEQGLVAVAIAMVEPTTARHHIAFKLGMHAPMDRGAAAYAIRAGGPPIKGEPEVVVQARELGFARSHGEVETDAYGVAAWIPLDDAVPRACLNLITYREDVADAAGPHIRQAADEVGKALTQRAD